MNGQLLTAEQVAARWQVPTSHVYRLAREGRVPVVELGRYRRFDPQAVEDFERKGGAGVKAQTSRRPLRRAQ
jgi:excisionase family DNA binding protein